SRSVHRRPGGPLPGGEVEGRRSRCLAVNVQMPAATTVLLIRHGQSRGNAERRFGGHTATPLSTRGRKQAEATALTLKSESITAIYSSDLERAIETARPL